MRFAIVTLGSAGDLHPFLAVARELVRQGHDVHFLSQAPYEDEVRREGPQFVSVVDEATHLAALRHPLLWHPIDGFGVLWRHLAVPAIGPTCEVLGRLSGEGEQPLVVFASPLAVGARFAKARWPDRIRLLSGYTAPTALRSTGDPMFLGPWCVPKWLPASLRIQLWRGLDRWKLDPMARPALRRWARQWSMGQPNRCLIGDWIHSPEGGIAMYPEWFAKVPAAWAARGVTQAGFPVYVPSGEPPSPEALVEFIAANPQFAVVYPGSAAIHASHFVDLASHACAECQLPAIIIARDTLVDTRAAASGDSPPTLTLPWADLDALLAVASVIIHHGGIGTCAQAHIHSTAQLIFASAYDQFENGERVSRLGVGQWMRLQGLTSDEATRSLAKTLRMTHANRDRRHPSQLPRQAPDSSTWFKPNQSVSSICRRLTESIPAA